MANIVGTAGNDTLIGTSEADTIQGLAGDDTIFGGTGAANTLIGGADNDIYHVDAAGDSIVENTGEGDDRVRTTLSFFALPANVEGLFYIGSGPFDGLGNALDNVTAGGASTDTLSGGDGADYLVGGQGSDRLLGGAGAANLLQGGSGNDVYYVDAFGDSVVENAGEGFDQVRTSLSSYTLNANVEELFYTGGGNFAGVGNDGTNLIVGGAGNDVLDGRGGDNQLYGRAGNDILIGGTDGQANTLIGETGDDVYFVARTGGYSVIELPGEGNDQVRTSASNFSLAANIEQLIFVGIGDFVGVGNDGANLIVGGDGNDILNGGDGNDTLSGGTGNDILLGGSGSNTLIGGTGRDGYFVDSVGDTVVEQMGEGNDQVRTTLPSYTLPANIEELIFAGTGNFTGIGNTLGNYIRGGSGNDTLNGGGGGYDILEGGAGNDHLVSASEMIGGPGDDRYTNGGKIVELSGEGHEPWRRQPRSTR